MHGFAVWNASFFPHACLFPSLPTITSRLILRRWEERAERRLEERGDGILWTELLRPSRIEEMIGDESVSRRERIVEEKRDYREWRK